MAAEIVHHQVDRRGVRVLAGQFSHGLGELESRTIRRRERKMAASLRFYGAEDIGCAAPLIFIVPAQFPSRFGRYRGTNVGVQGDGFLIETDQGMFGRALNRILLQHVFHCGDKPGTDRGNAPLFMLPGFEFVFLSNWRIVSGEMPLTKPNSMALPANIRNVQ